MYLWLQLLQRRLYSHIHDFVDIIHMALGALARELKNPGILAQPQRSSGCLKRPSLVPLLCIVCSPQVLRVVGSGPHSAAAQL